VAFVSLLVAFLAAAVAVFALQNGTPATVRVFVWNLAVRELEAAAAQRNKRPVTPPTAAP
jgi:hypothetical protein